MNIVKPYTEAEINAHAAKVGGKQNLREIEIITDDFQYIFLAKIPSRAVIQAISHANSKNDVNAAAKLLIGCVLEGDMQAVEDNGAIYMSLVEQLTSLVGSAKASIKKL